MTTFHTDGESRFMAATKGAPDVLIERCTRIMRRDGKIGQITPSDVEAILKENSTLAAQAYRVLAMAFKPLDAIQNILPAKRTNGIWSCAGGHDRPTAARSRDAIKGVSLPAFASS